MMSPASGQRPWLEHQAKFHPDRTALVSENSSLTFSELHRQALLLARELKQQGVSKGDFAGVISQNSREQFIVFHALLLLGAVIVPINHKLSKSEIESIIKNIALNVIIYSDELDLNFDNIPEALSIHSLFEKTVNIDSIEAPQLSGEDICAIFFTSGTTGEPKPVPLTWANFFHSAMGSALNIGMTSLDNWLLCLPMDHIGGFSILMRSLIYGTSVTLLPSFSTESVLKLLNNEDITHISLVPTMLARLLKHEFSVPDSLRAVLLGGGPANNELVSEAIREGLPVLRTYGLTEACSQVTTTPIDQIDSKLGSSGKPLAFSEVRIAGEDGYPKPVGQTGEIIIRGKTVTSGYLNQPDENKSKFVDGLLRTGDYGYFDGDGYLFTLSRKDDVIITGGENVMPEEVESALLSNSNVRDACVFGVKDSEWGERIVAALVLHQSATELNPGDIIDSTELARYKQPKDYIVVDDIPRTSLGKPKRDALRELYRKRAKDAD